MKKPRTFYLTEFPDGYKNRTWWEESEKQDAESFLDHVENDYGIRGKLVKVQAVEE